MFARTKPHGAPATAVRVTTATRTNAEPGRAGALRLALLSAFVAALVGAAAYFGAYSSAVRDALSHLDVVRHAAARSLERTLEAVRNDTATLAEDPRTARLLDGGQGRTNTNGGAGSQPWIEAASRRGGFEGVLIIDAAGSQIVYSTVDLPPALRSLRGGGHVAGDLGKLVRATSERSPGGPGVYLGDLERSALFGGHPVMLSAAPIFDGSTRVGTLVTAIGREQLESALAGGSDAERWHRLGLGEGGDIVAVGPDGKLRTTPRSFLVDPEAFWARAGVESPPEGADASPIGLAAAGSSGIERAFAAGDTNGRFTTASGPVLGSYGPTPVGDHTWIVGMERPESEILDSLRPLLSPLILVTVVAAVLGWMLGGRLWQQFGRQLHRLTAGAQRALRGDRSARIDSAGRGAVGDLAGVINRLLDERQLLLERNETESQRVNSDATAIVEVVREVAGGNLAQRSDVAEGSLASVSRALNEMLDTVGTLVSSLKQTTNRVGTSADQIRSSAEQASRGAETQARDCGTTTASAEELKLSAERVAQQCAAALELARRTDQASRQGQTAIGDVIAGMDSLQRETRTATVKIKRLGERSMQISAIIGTISKMSAQTDMLALNAAIEASRAGEHGQGFAVVAEEVRKLAERAAAATKEIERLINGIQSDVNEAVSGMERQGERLEVQTAAAAEAQHGLERVMGATAEASLAIQAIAQGAESQANGIVRLEHAISGLVAGAQGVQQSTEVARKTTGDLIHAFEELDARASQFHS
jgi:methyl-accepting chemotaxis protein